MAGKVLVDLTTGMEDPEHVTLAFLVAGAALEQPASSRTRRRSAT